MGDGFQISKKHHPIYGGRYYSQLNEIEGVSDDIQASLLNYEISVDLLVNMPDEEVLDIFGRLNSYAVVLNEQEKLHAMHFGLFKSLAEKLGHKYYRFWVGSKILSENNILRMADANLTSDLLIAMIEGIKNKKQIKKYYNEYETRFEHDVEALERQFDQTMQTVQDLYPDGLESTEFHRPPLFYSLFTTLFHLQFGLKNFDKSSLVINPRHYARISNELNRVTEIFTVDDAGQLTKNERQFLEDARRATTDPSVRIRRTEFLLGLIRPHAST